MATWGFLTNHAHVLIQVARNPRSTVREISLATGITERATIHVMQDLRASGILSTWREGRQNTNLLRLDALGEHRPWGASAMEIPQALIDAALNGLKRLARKDAQLRQAQPVPAKKSAGNSARRWGFLTTHAGLLLYVTQHPHSTVREIALAVMVTERAAHSVLQDLRAANIIDCERQGRRNSYSVNFERLAPYRREGTAPDLVPASFVFLLLEALLALRPAV